MQDFSAKYIYEPWKAPIADQKAANCRIGVDYPKPICDHAQVSKENVQKLKEAYANQPPHSKSPAKAISFGSKAHAAAEPSQAGAGHPQAAAERSQAGAGQSATGAQQSADNAGQTGIQSPPASAGDSTHNSTGDHQAPTGQQSSSSRQRRKGAVHEAHPPFGFDDVAMPQDSQDAGDHETDAAEPEATMPGGTATGKTSKPLDPDDNAASPGPKGSEVPEALAKQKKLDWSAVAAAGEKRKRDDAAETSPQATRRSPRQKKLNFPGKS